MDKLAWAAFGYSILGLFVLGAIRLAGRADEATEQAARDRPDGDCWPYAPQIFPVHTSEIDRGE